jgi:hypothetical protein
VESNSSNLHVIGFMQVSPSSIDYNTEIECIMPRVDISISVTCKNTY